MADVFKALADPTRRQILDRLREEDGLTLFELCGRAQMSRQAISKHLTILEQAGLVVCQMKGRNKHHFLNAVPLQDIVDRWVSQFRQQQSQALLDLKKRAEQDHD